MINNLQLHRISYSDHCRWKQLTSPTVSRSRCTCKQMRLKHSTQQRITNTLTASLTFRENEKWKTIRVQASVSGAGVSFLHLEAWERSVLCSWFSYATLIFCSSSSRAVEDTHESEQEHITVSLWRRAKEPDWPLMISSFTFCSSLRISSRMSCAQTERRFSVGERYFLK